MSSMLSKSKRPYDASEMSPGKRLRANVVDLYANNVLAASRCQELINDASGAGASGLGDLRRQRSQNTSRFLRKAFEKRSQWPKDYWAQVRVKKPKTDEEEWSWCALCLPHEYLQMLARLGDREVLHDRAGLAAASLAHLQSCEAKAGQQLVAMGLWGDGVPTQWDRTETVEAVSLNLPGQSGKWAPMRLPVTAFPRRRVSENTWDDVLSVVAWSLQHAAVGVHPSCRHDGSAWLSSDRLRAKSSGERALARAALVEVRGDWVFFAEVFGFPRHNMSSGICWRCRATPAEARDQTRPC